jgi:glucose-1-phosphate adenylyltransferase
MSASPQPAASSPPMNMDRVLAVILGGGAGTRLFPLTARRAKPAVPLAGKYRLVDVPISNCINSGVSRIFVLTQYNSASLNNHIARSYNFDRFRGGFITLLAAEQTPSSEAWYQGTADAVRQSVAHFASYPHDEVIVLSGDQLYTMDYRVMLEHHRRHRADITVAATPVTADEAPGFGILKTSRDGGHRITEFYEKPKRDTLRGKESPVTADLEAKERIYLASMGIYIFECEVLRELLDAHPDDHDFGKEIIPAAIHERRVVAFPFEGYWNDIGTVRSFFETNLMLAEPGAPFDLFDPHMPLYTNARLLPPSKVTNSRVDRAIIAEACVIEDADISDAVIGIRSFIGAGARVHRAVIMGADYFRWEEPGSRRRVGGPLRPGIGAGSVVEGAIVDKNASIGKRCRITNESGVQDGDGPGFCIRDGIVVVVKNAEIPDDTII